MKGLHCGIYRRADGYIDPRTNRPADCTNGGLSSKVDSVTLVGEGVDGPFEPSEKAPVLYYMTGPYGPRACVEPKYFGRGMFGGNFIYTSDSRFPESAPIKIFDRFE